MKRWSIDARANPSDAGGDVFHTPSASLYPGSIPHLRQFTLAMCARYHVGSLGPWPTSVVRTKTLTMKPPSRAPAHRARYKSAIFWVHRFGREIVGDCIRYLADNGKLVLTRRMFLGKLDADVTFGGEPPFFITFQSGSFRGENAQGGRSQIETMDVSVGDIRMSSEEPFQEAKASVDLTKSEVIVAIGRGIKSQENIALAQQLADALGADLAASRPICDSEWLPIDRQIGSSGQTVAPKLYIALGISGAIQHIVGMKNSGTVVAINKDAEAPIFDIADYGIVGDLFEAVPVMIDEIKKAKQ